MPEITKDQIKHIFAYNTGNGEVVLQGVEIEEYCDMEDKALQAIAIKEWLQSIGRDMLKVQEQIREFDALTAGGVDNWEGYYVAMRKIYPDPDFDDDGEDEDLVPTP